MAWVKLHFDVQGEAQYSRALELYDDELADLREPLGQARDVIVDSVKEQFASQGAHGGGRWEPLNPAYAAYRRQHFPEAGTILRRTDKLYNALVYGGTRQLTAHRLEYGIDPAFRYRPSEGGESVADVGRFHQAGSGHLPQRKILALTSLERRQLDRVFVEWVQARRRAIIGSGLR